MRAWVTASAEVADGAGTWGSRNHGKQEAGEAGARNPGEHGTRGGRPGTDKPSGRRGRVSVVPPGGTTPGRPAAGLTVTPTWTANPTGPLIRLDR